MQTSQKYDIIIYRLLGITLFLFVNNIYYRGGAFMRKGGEIMTRTMSRMNSIPTHVVKELGFEENWQKNISPRQQKMALKMAEKFKGALRKLSKN